MKTPVTVDESIRNRENVIDIVALEIGEGAGRGEKMTSRWMRK